MKKLILFFGVILISFSSNSISAIYANELSFSAQMIDEDEYSESKLNIDFVTDGEWGEFSLKTKNSIIKTNISKIDKNFSLVNVDFYFSDNYGVFSSLQSEMKTDIWDGFKRRILTGVIYDFFDLTDKSKDLKLSYASGQSYLDGIGTNIHSGRIKYKGILFKDFHADFVYWNIYEVTEGSSLLKEMMEVNLMMEDKSYKYGIGYNSECFNADCSSSLLFKYSYIF